MGTQSHSFICYCPWPLLAAKAGLSGCSRNCVVHKTYLTFKRWFVIPSLDSPSWLLSLGIHLASVLTNSFLKSCPIQVPRRERTKFLWNPYSSIWSEVKEHLLFLPGRLTSHGKAVCGWHVLSHPPPISCGWDTGNMWSVKQSCLRGARASWALLQLHIKWANACKIIW